MKGESGKTDYYGPVGALTRTGLGSVKSTNHGTTDSENTMGKFTGALIGAEVGGIQGAIEGYLIGGLLD